MPSFRMPTLAALALAAGLLLSPTGVPPRPGAPRAATPDAARQALEAGNRRFLSGEPASRDLRAEVEATASGQTPFAAVVGCLDSRVPPEIVFDQGIGDLFVARVAGNFVNTDIIGSFEFATALSGADLIVVLGHSRCGAVRGACDGVQLGNLTQTLSNLAPAVYAVRDAEDRTSANADFVQSVAEAHVALTVQALTSRSAILSGLVAQGDLAIVGAMYDVATGRVTFMD